MFDTPDSNITLALYHVFGISNELMQILKWTILTGVCQFINIFGIVTNIINIICFVNQGFHDPVNISLLGMFTDSGLSISDLGCLTTLLCTNVILLTPLMRPTGLPFDPLAINYMVFFMPHLAFSRVTSWITAIITLERCLCIVAPLKVKTMFTRRRMTAIIACAFFFLFLCGAPVYSVNRLGPTFIPEENETIIGMLYMNGRETVDTILFAVNNFFIPLSAFFVIVICTVILVYKLHNLAKWRRSTSSVTGNVTNRNQKVAKMVVMISTLFIACFIPLSVYMLALAFEPELSVNGKYINIAIVLAGIGFVLESINSSVNIFIYYTMSSKFRATFHIVFCRDNVLSQLGDVD